MTANQAESNSDKYKQDLKKAFYEARKDINKYRDK